MFSFKFFSKSPFMTKLTLKLNTFKQRKVQVIDLNIVASKAIIDALLRFELTIAIKAHNFITH